MLKICQNKKNFKKNPATPIGVRNPFDFDGIWIGAGGRSTQERVDNVWTMVKLFTIDATLIDISSYKAKTMRAEIKTERVVFFNVVGVTEKA